MQAQTQKIASIYESSVTALVVMIVVVVAVVLEIHKIYQEQSTKKSGLNLKLPFP